MSGPSPEELQGRIDARRERYAVAGVAVGTGVYQPVFMSFEDGRPQYFFATRLTRRVN